jgi:periplasmic protein TonB
VSVAIHAALITLAVDATASPSTPAAGLVEGVDSLYFSRLPAPREHDRTTRERTVIDVMPKAPASPQPPLPFIDVGRIPPIDVTRGERWGTPDGAFGRSEAGGDGAGYGGLPGSDVYEEPSVDRMAAPLPGNPPCAYPRWLERNGIEGRVLAEFVIDTAGRAELASFVAIESSHPLFTAAVRDALARMRFAPAEAGGRKVRVRVRMPFEFRIRDAGEGRGRALRPNASSTE